MQLESEGKRCLEVLNGKMFCGSLEYFSYCLAHNMNYGLHVFSVAPSIQEQVTAGAHYSRTNSIGLKLI